VQNDDLNPENLSPDQMDDAELLIFRSLLRQQIAHDPANVAPELSDRYRRLNDEVTKRIRGIWS
jgi:hypothetical protein